jgi:hypothetical protein
MEWIERERVYQFALGLRHGNLVLVKIDHLCTMTTTHNIPEPNNGTKCAKRPQIRLQKERGTICPRTGNAPLRQRRAERDPPDLRTVADTPPTTLHVTSTFSPAGGPVTGLP